MNSTVLEVSGMTCGHCVNAVTEELKAIGVQEVSVDLVADGVSKVTITADQLPDDAAIRAALDEAGDYQLG